MWTKLPSHYWACTWHTPLAVGPSHPSPFTGKFGPGMETKYLMLITQWPEIDKLLTYPLTRRFYGYFLQQAHIFRIWNTWLVVHNGKQIPHRHAISIFLVIFGAHVNILFIITLKILVFIQIITCLETLVYTTTYLQIMRNRSDMAPLSCPNRVGCNSRKWSTQFEITKL